MQPFVAPSFRHDALKTPVQIVTSTDLPQRNHCHPRWLLKAAVANKRKLTGSLFQGMESLPLITHFIPYDKDTELSNKIATTAILVILIVIYS